MEQDGQLDLTSEGFFRPNPPPPRPSTRRHDGRIRLYFQCCRVYSLATLPAHLLTGRQSTWRIHCPRCGRLSEIPVED